MVRSTWLLAALALTTACSSKPTASTQALLASVTFEAGTASQCVRVVATPSAGEARATEVIAKKERINVAVYRSADWSEDVTLVARGYVSCSAALEDFDEQSHAVTARFEDGDPPRVELLVKKKNNVVDNDGDGKGGIDDCDDNDPQRFAGNIEACNSTVDNNCSFTTGCLDPLCTGACSPAGLGSCQGGVCVGNTELLCDDQADNDGDSLIDCRDPDCVSQSCTDGSGCTSGDSCQSDGGCAGTPVVLDCSVAPGSCFFAPGACNPLDGGCMFTTKDAGTVCSDGNACTQNETCTANGDCAGPAMTTRTCTAPPNSQCYDALGVCNPQDAGCDYTPKTGSCDDGQLCTDNDTCQGGSCVGSPKLCFQSSNPCKQDGGSCDPGSGQCTFGNAPNTNSCNDNNACTLLDQCSNGSCLGQSPTSCAATDVCHDAGTCDPGTGACSNPTVTCTPRNECEGVGTCAVATSGCTFIPANEGGACNSATGTCQSGVCVATFIPFDGNPAASNFSPDAGRQPTEAVVINCAATLSQNLAGVVTLNACGTTLTSADGGIEVITQGGITTSLVKMASLVITDAGTLTIGGPRPVIFAVYGNAAIGGVINASANGFFSGPGGDNGCNGAPNGNKTGGNGGSGGAGGAFGATGGLGGPGDGTAQVTPAAQATGNDALTPLRGGCRGGAGGSENTFGPAGGGGGGAFQLSVSGRLRLWGTIGANGAGGFGAGQSGGEGDGAGGGGSGGAVLVEADELIIEDTARLFANGGSGGEGGDNALASNASNGQQGIRAYGTTPPGGDLGSGTNGGAGGGGANPAGANVSTSPGTDDGGGGGGGSMGRIRVNYNTGCRENGYVVSPSGAPTTPDTGAGSTGFTSNKGSLPAIGNGGVCP